MNITKSFFAIILLIVFSAGSVFGYGIFSYRQSLERDDTANDLDINAAARDLIKTLQNSVNRDDQNSQAPESTNSNENAASYRSASEQSLKKFDDLLEVIASAPNTATEVQKTEARNYLRDSIYNAKSAIESDRTDVANWTALLNAYARTIDNGITSIDGQPIYTQLTEVADEMKILFEDLIEWRLQLAPLYYGLSLWQETLLTLAQANEIQSDIPALHYWAAKAFAMQEDYTNAVVEANIVINLTDASDPLHMEMQTSKTLWQSL